MEYKSFMEALKGNQHKLDKNKNGKLDAHDFKLLRKEETEELDEAMSPQQKSDFDRMMAGAMSRAAYNAKWKKPLKSDSKVIYGKNVKEEVELDEADVQARAYYKLDKSGRKYHKQIHFKDGSNDEANEKNEIREETDMNEEMTDAQKAERERIVKGMKKNLAGFKAKYGERAKEVMYATATKMAMKEESELEEQAPVAPSLVKHRIGVTVSDPNATSVTARKEKVQKFVRVTHSDNKEGAQKVGEKHFKKKGYVVHDSWHAGMVNEEVELDESVKIVDRDSDLDQEHFKLHVNGKPVHFVHHNYENSHASDSKDDIHYQVKNQLKHLSPQHQKAVTNAVHASYRIKEETDSVGFDEEGNLMAEKLTYAQFMEQLLEYTPGPGGVTRVQGRSYGAQYHDPEGDDDADDKPKKKAEPAVKRGRGRPAGSKSGANQKVTSGKSYGGIATHSLHLPSSNR